MELQTQRAPESIATAYHHAGYRCPHAADVTSLPHPQGSRDSGSQLESFGCGQEKVVVGQVVMHA